jgi:hypothetical protein
MPLAPTINSRLATTAFVCGVLAFPLWVLSYAWVPFALIGREPDAIMYVVMTGEAGGLLASLGAVGCGLIGRMRTQSGTRAHRLASQGLAMGTIVLVLLVVLNIVGIIVFAES